MILTEKRTYIFHAILERTFQTETGESKLYYQVLAFAVNPDGSVADEQSRLKVDKEAVSSLKTLKKGEKVTLNVGAFLRDGDLRIYNVAETDFFE